ncbi:hypothetical protein BT67DRAFT_445303 [Trichocladium antarcticum]|uniref:Uncharacterized protein n=1 Tax=Trichocladium antarcticum TaxID=1450529 RepID=A0AAN6UDY2_9PEZI|nr:hypothetical protein BT67DRAFT_445303 [Trichocladium antarcticum]
MTHEGPTPPARDPAPWTWRCHECYSEYPLACTRRCLECSHILCTARATTTATTARSKRRRQQGCRAEFDYDGWAAWGAFRRTVATQGATKDAISTSVPTSRRRRKLDADCDKFATWDSRSKLTAGGSYTSVWRPVARAEYERVVRRKEEMYVQGHHNCWLHCDYPSECLRAVDAARRRGRGAC